MSLTPMLAEQRITEMRRAAESTRPRPEPRQGRAAARVALGRTLVRFGERLARPARVPVTR